MSTLLQAQTGQSITDEGEEVMAQEEQLDLSSAEADENGYNMWSDPLYYQFEKMMPELARSIGRLDSRISTLAVTDLDFSPSIDESFRKVAGAKLYGQLLMENPKLKLVKCNECNLVRSEVNNGILTITRGLATEEDRIKLAEKIGVQGFMTAMIIEERRQLTIVVNVYDAEEGRIILSDVITGVPVADTVYYGVYLGQMTIPINVVKSGTTTSGVDHTAIILGAEYSKRFSENFMITTNVAAYMDNNSKLADPKETITPGLLFDGTIGWQMMSVMNNDLSIILMGGVGQFLSTQFNFAFYYKGGFKVIVNKFLTFNYQYLMFNETNIAAPESGATTASSLPGNASYMGFGLQF